MRVKLLNAGYRQFEPNNHACRAYQKCIRDNHGKLYFITVYEYHTHHEGLENTFEADVQFNTDDGLTFDVKIHNGWTIEQMETVFDEIFWTMSCNPYDG